MATVRRTTTLNARTHYAFALLISIVSIAYSVFLVWRPFFAGASTVIVLSVSITMLCCYVAHLGYDEMWRRKMAEYLAKEQGLAWSVAYHADAARALQEMGFQYAANRRELSEEDKHKWWEISQKHPRLRTKDEFALMKFFERQGATTGQTAQPRRAKQTA